MEIEITDERGEEVHKTSHLYEGGISEFVSQINKVREAMHENVIVISGEKELELGTVTVDLALQWSNAFSESIRCYTNIIRNKDGGTHMSGLRTALTSCVNSYAKKKNMLKGDSLSGDDVREGLTLLSLLNTQTPHFFSNQTN